MTRWFKGIDFANRQKNIGECYLEVIGQTLVAHFDKKDEQPEQIGVDCPFGTSLGFFRLLQYQTPRHKSGDAYKTRHTERWLREHLWNYQTNEHWRDNVADDPKQYVNKTAHVQPTLGLQIVPGFLEWFQDEVGNARFGDSIKASRRGDNTFVESHPRPFLYSAVERIWCNVNTTNPTDDMLRAVAQYKDKPKVSRVRQRCVTYDLLKKHTAIWLGAGYSLADPPDALFETDHAFDAWLSAVTAFAHTEGMTITWQDAGISEEEVNVEGHILKQAARQTAE